MNVLLLPTSFRSLLLQTNIRIDGQGIARIAGFASATLALGPGIALEDIDLGVESNVSRWCSPEMLHPDGFDLAEARTLKARDVYAFGMLAYEVSATLQMVHSCY